MVSLCPCVCMCVCAPCECVSVSLCVCKCMPVCECVCVCVSVQRQFEAPLSPAFSAPLPHAQVPLEPGRCDPIPSAVGARTTPGEAPTVLQDWASMCVCRAGRGCLWNLMGFCPFPEGAGMGAQVSESWVPWVPKRGTCHVCVDVVWAAGGLVRGHWGPGCPRGQGWSRCRGWGGGQGPDAVRLQSP